MRHYTNTNNPIDFPKVYNRFETVLNSVQPDTSGKWVKTEEVRRVAEQVLGISVAYLKECDSDFEGEMLEDFWYSDQTPEAL